MEDGRMPDEKRWDPAAGAYVPLARAAPPARRFTAQELRACDGQAGAPIYVAVDGIVFDVTKEARLYGPAGSYGKLAGRDASSALAQNNMGATLARQCVNTAPSIAVEHRQRPHFDVFMTHLQVPDEAVRVDVAVAVREHDPLGAGCRAGRVVD